MVTPGYAPSRDAHHFPYSAEVSQAIGETFAALATSDLFDDAQRATLGGALRHLHPLARAARRATGDPHGFWARAASHMAVPEGDRGRRCCRPSCPTSRSQGLRGAARRARPRTGMVGGDAAGGARGRSSTASARPSPEALAGIATLRGIAATLFYALPDLGTGRNPNWDAIGYPGPRSPPPADRERPLDDAPPERRRGDDRGRRLRRRLRRRRRRDRRRAGRGGQAGRACSRWAATTTSPTSTGSSCRPTSTSTSTAARSRPPRARSRSSPAPALGGGTVINWTNCLRTYRPGPRASGRASTASRASTSPTTTPTSTRSSSGSASTTTAAT